MGEEQLLQLAQEFLFSDAGKKLVGEDIDLSVIENQIKSEIQSQALGLESKASGIDITKKPTLSREERKANREEEKIQNREEREKRKEERKEERAERKEARQERGGTIGQFIPKFGSYKVSGTVYNKFNNRPIKGILVSPAIKDPISGIPIVIGTGSRVAEEVNGKKTIKKEEVETNKEGKFEISLRLPFLPYNGKVLLEVYLMYTANSQEVDNSARDEEGNLILDKNGNEIEINFSPGLQPILTREREVKEVLPIFPLTDLATAAEDALPAYLREYYPVYKDIREATLAPKEKALIFRKQRILKSVEVIQTRLLPLAIELLLAFGITKLSERNQKICPPASALNTNTERRNRVVRQLNQIFRQITLNTAIAAALTAIAGSLRSGRKTIENLPLPLGAPIAVGVPYSVVSKLQTVEAVLKEFESDNTELNKQIVNGLVLLTAAITTILVLLKLLDELTQECATELNIQPEAISQELLDLTSEANEEGVVSVNQINGFTLEVQAMDQNAAGNLKRRQAVGKNSQGIILVKGDPSFSSSDQILINELAFYIQSNNLKAF
jgi:hypothetical protein